MADLSFKLGKLLRPEYCYLVSDLAQAYTNLQEVFELRGQFYCSIAPFSSTFFLVGSMEILVVRCIDKNPDSSLIILNLDFPHQEIHSISMSIIVRIL